MLLADGEEIGFANPRLTTGPADYGGRAAGRGFWRANLQLRGARAAGADRSFMAFHLGRNLINVHAFPWNVAMLAAPPIAGAAGAW